MGSLVCCFYFSARPCFLPHLICFFPSFYERDADTREREREREREDEDTQEKTRTGRRIGRACARGYGRSGHVRGRAALRFTSCRWICSHWHGNLISSLLIILSPFLLLLLLCFLLSHFFFPSPPCLLS